MIANGEGESVEFKSSTRWDYRAGAINKGLESRQGFTNCSGQVSRKIPNHGQLQSNPLGRKRAIDSLVRLLHRFAHLLGALRQFTLSLVCLEGLSRVTTISSRVGFSLEFDDSARSTSA